MDEFLKEAGVMMNLRPHPNVVTFLGICVKQPLCIGTDLQINLQTTDFSSSFQFVNFTRMEIC
jgi:hypothetical protein